MDAKQLMTTGREADRSPFFQGMRGTLLAWFVVLALAPMILVSVISYTRAKEALTQFAEDKLVAVREIKANILLTLFRKWEADTLNISQMESLKSDMVDMATSFKFLDSDKLRNLYLEKPDLLDAQDGSAYSAVHREDHDFFKNYIRVQEYEDLLLIDPEGNVFYSEKKGPDFGVNLTSEPYRESNLGRLYQALKGVKRGEVLLADAALYGNGVALFMGTPVYREDVCLGYLVFRLPLGHINQRMAEREGMGRTGETILAGPDLRLRSDSFNDPVNRTLRASLSGTVKDNGVGTEPVRRALAGKSGAGINTDYRGTEILVSYAPIPLKGLQWVIVSKVDADEAMAPTVSLLWVTAGLGCGAALLAILVALFVSGRIVRPVRRLTEWSREIAGGELTLVDIKTPKNEIGVLNESFREAVKSLRTAKAAQEQHNWLKTGQSDLDDRMRGEQIMETLCRQVITYVTVYLGAQVGAFYVKDGSGLFRLAASYAYKAPGNLANEFKVGEGLIGQAALEKRPILLTKVPENYITVTSGLGERRPKNILVMPLVFGDATLGVMEMGSFEEFSEDHKAFLEEVGERIAIAIHSASARDRLHEVLVVTQQQSEELQVRQKELQAANEELEEHTRRLQSSEEELKAQQEELQAANEELEEQTQQLQASEELLKTQHEELQATNEELEEKTHALEQERNSITVKNRELEVIGLDLERRAKELEITGRYKSEFLANMSHELRSPLNSLLLLAQELAANKQQNLDDRQIESAEIIYHSGHDLLNLINEILDLSKIEAGRMELHIAEVSLAQCAEDLVAEFKPQADARGLELSTRLSGKLPETIASDRQRLDQILRNLIANAIKFTRAGSITLDLHRPQPGVLLRRSGLDPLQAVAISVIDTGIGIADDKQMLIFEAFLQADDSTSRQYGGTGLGLSISRELAKLLGGEITVESKEGEGATFTLYLPEKHRPARMPSDEPAVRAITPVAARPAPTRPPGEAIADDRDTIQADDRVILVIEDDLHFAQTLHRFCHERRFKCLHAADGESGLELAARFKPDAVILDIRLPGIGGWTVLETLKSDPDLRHIPVHMMSIEQETVEAYRKGAIGFLSKPVSLQQLNQAFNRIEKVIRRHVKRLLVVEDDPVMSRKIAELIGNGDVETKSVGNGRDALEELRTGAYDCVILDLKLPDISGFEVLKQLDTFKEITIPPIIIYTGKDLTHDEEYQLQQYASSIIVKGVKSQERLLDETALFLHRVIKDLPSSKRAMISTLYDSETIFEGKKILMVDDDMRNVFALSKVLEEQGMQVFKAADGQKALALLDKEPDMHMVLMDIMMPIMDGYEALRRIRSQPRFQHLPILAITAKAMKEDRVKCIEAGANDYLAKPVDIDKLLSLMRVWLYR